MNIDDLTKRVIRCAYDVGNHMGYGFLESVYEKCMLIELKRAGLDADPQVPIRLIYKGVEVGDFFADIVVNQVLILEIKKVADIHSAHEAQLVHYLNATGIDHGLLINFASSRVEVKRKFRAYKHPHTPPTSIL
jgi:GxxExxY protein